VRGTPQQIIEKYQMLARDAQLSGDRVAAENFQQHAEHYTRMLGDAMREQNERREQQEAQQAQNAQPSNPAQNEQPGGNGQRAPRNQSAERDEQPRNGGYEASQNEAPMVPVREMQIAEDSGLVDTPESASDSPPPPVKKRRARTPKAPKPEAPSEVNPAD